MRPFAPFILLVLAVGCFEKLRVVYPAAEGDTGDTATDTADTAADSADTADTGGTDTAEVDADGDGYTVSAGDCDDTNNAVNPAASEACNGVDDNCDGNVDEGIPTSTWYGDNDGDGYGNPRATAAGCSAPVGYAARPSSRTATTTTAMASSTKAPALISTATATRARPATATTATRPATPARPR